MIEEESLLVLVSRAVVDVVLVVLKISGFSSGTFAGQV
jgi:hypothetical protein